MTAPALPIRTGRLLLRGYRRDDAAALLDYYHRPDVVALLLDDPWDVAMAERRVSERMAHRDITAEGFAFSVVAVDADDRVVGDLTLWAADATLERFEISWVMHHDHTGRGYATEAARALVGLAFDHYRAHRVLARLDARNDSSARLCERIGMRREGLLRQDWFSKGEWTDTLVYGVLASDR